MSVRINNVVFHVKNQILFNDAASVRGGQEGGRLIVKTLRLHLLYLTGVTTYLIWVHIEDYRQSLV